MHRIRLAKEKELKLLSQLDHRASLTPWTLENYASSWNNSNHKIFVLEENNQIIGAIVMGIASDEGEILQFWIKKELHHQGYGKKLLQYIIDSCQKNLVQEIFLEVRSDNTPARKLYEKLGFANVGIRKDYYKVDGWVFDAIIMQKKL